jgi:RNA polymerase sigma-70 factor (sigma-E family)
VLGLPFVNEVAASPPAHDNRSGSGGVSEDVNVDPSFDTFVERRSTALLRTAYLLTGDYGHAEDLLQTALLRTIRHWRRARDSPEAYVRRTLVNLAHDRIRLLRRRPREAPLPDDDSATGGATAHPGDDSDGVERAGERLEDRERLVRALGQLPMAQRKVVVLRFFEDLSVAQTAQLLRCSEGTVKSHTSRALAHLRGLLRESPPTTAPRRAPPPAVFVPKESSHVC